MNTSKQIMGPRGGFSLTEMLIATGIMAVGLVLVALIFPVGVKLTTMSTERTIAAVVADEAFAKVQLYGLRDFDEWPADDPNTACSDFVYIADYDFNDDGSIDEDDFLDSSSDWADFYYPSDNRQEDRKYCWSVLCRRVGDRDVQLTAFISRIAFANVAYYAFLYDGSDYNPGSASLYPSPIRLSVEFDDDDTDDTKANILYLVDDTDYTAATARTFLDEGYVIVDDYSGKIYHIQEMTDENDDDMDEIILREEWEPDEDSPQDGAVWVVPPALGSSRYPCVGVFQKVVRFDDILQED